MSLIIPPVAFTQYASNITVPSDPDGTTLTADATIHTKGAYAELVASLGFDACWIELMMGDASTTNTATDVLVDIAIGAAADETVVIPNLLAGSATAGIFYGQRYAFPLYIPSGSRVSARCQALITGDTVSVAIRLWGGPSRPTWVGHQVTAYGPDVATSAAIAVTPGTSSSEGAWTEITASATAPHRFLASGVAIGPDISTPSSNYLLDLGVGAATESAILEDHFFVTSTAEAIWMAGPCGVWADIPEGTRLVARISEASATTQPIHVAIYGVS